MKDYRLLPVISINGKAQESAGDPVRTARPRASRFESYIAESAAAMSAAASKTFWVQATPTLARGSIVSVPMSTRSRNVAAIRSAIATA
jgi:hypothetical protein